MTVCLKHANRKLLARKTRTQDDSPAVEKMNNGPGQKKGGTQCAHLCVCVCVPVIGFLVPRICNKHDRNKEILEIQQNA